MPPNMQMCDNGVYQDSKILCSSVDVTRTWYWTCSCVFNFAGFSMKDYSTAARLQIRLFIENIIEKCMSTAIVIKIY